MADLSKIKVGDRLRLEVEVQNVSRHREDGAWPIYASLAGHASHLMDTWVEAAEHVPAPKTFKRGDRVRYANGAYNGGLVLFLEAGKYKVHWWPDEDVTTERAEVLELEAPE